MNCEIMHSDSGISLTLKACLTLPELRQEQLEPLGETKRDHLLAKIEPLVKRLLVVYAGSLFSSV